LLNTRPEADYSHKGPALAPRKRPRQERSAETVAVIVEAAARILERDGLEGYTTNAVAERAGVSIGSLYQYFPHKEAITRALIEREAKEVANDVANALADENLTRALTGLVHVAVSRQLARPRLAGLLDLEEDRLGGAARPQAEFEAVHTALSLRLRGDLRGCATDDLASDIIALVRTLCDAAGKRPAMALEGVSARLTGAVLGYIGPIGE
jgi:AcrR family transcriptional regulator